MPPIFQGAAVGSSDIIAANNAKAKAFAQELNNLLQGGLPGPSPQTPGVIRIEGTPGPEGPAGASGGSAYLIDEFTATSDGQQVRSYAQNCALGTNVYINGLKQTPNSFTVSGNSITLPTELNIEVGDIIVVEH